MMMVVGECRKREALASLCVERSIVNGAFPRRRPLVGTAPVCLNAPSETGSARAVFEGICDRKDRVKTEVERQTIRIWFLSVVGRTF